MLLRPPFVDSWHWAFQPISFMSNLARIFRHLLQPWYLLVSYFSIVPDLRPLIPIYIFLELSRLIAFADQPLIQIDQLAIWPPSTPSDSSRFAQAHNSWPFPASYWSLQTRTHYLPLALYSTSGQWSRDPLLAQIYHPSRRSESSWWGYPLQKAVLVDPTFTSA